ncbi:hypothetical protein [Gordonibacter massiliensis (ex Traore et al. 2017)]|uniref:hypothetical protein n=1 Tax=Gordonibacter massiliensis (ex Traore et al. 2017) TaxID=1841863 RepID=UPI001C8B61B1|nr:hypothetical protein [Gordonibacter massiliensis (ex Traore et al. 2017)]MBX9033399.1 hypothetical protein [Gordonibacter massiliensis (ex Traore et al. 2017)]
MDTIVLLIAVVVGLVALELLGMRAYRRHRARKAAAFTRENVGAVYDDLQAARAHCLAEKRAYGMLADAARAGGRAQDGAVLDALADGERAHLAAIEDFRGPLHAESVDPASRPPLPTSLDDALREVAVRADAWSTGPCRDAAARARVHGHRDIARLYRQLQEVEQAAACLCLDLAEGARPAEPLSRCPSCGLIVAGRRPAFCTVCTKPGFEFEDVEVSATAAADEAARPVSGSAA